MKGFLKRIDTEVKRDKDRHQHAYHIFQVMKIQQYFLSS